ncbi:CrcB family protein [Candidatus Methanomassiliicoccus intestinalis]|uniref:CrcB family protein n=1 Tax=Candidatus Methanomassiliicoccus intestinalis TaxID=1406512 RepID=UPI0037DC74C5
MKYDLALVFAGGGIGAIIREALMLIVQPFGGFPLSIFFANVVAAFLIGLATGMVTNGRLGTRGNLFFSTGIMGGMSTFSTFMHGTDQLLLEAMDFTALIYLIISMIVGLLLVLLGIRLGEGKKHST